MFDRSGFRSQVCLLRFAWPGFTGLGRFGFLDLVFLFGFAGKDLLGQICRVSFSCSGLLG